MSVATCNKCVFVFLLLAGRWNTCTKRVGTTQLWNHFGQLFTECIPSM